LRELFFGFGLLMPATATRADQGTEAYRPRRFELSSSDPRVVNGDADGVAGAELILIGGKAGHGLRTAIRANRRLRGHFPLAELIGIAIANTSSAVRQGFGDRPKATSDAVVQIVGDALLHSVERAGLAA